jgi:flagellar protein FlaG
MNTLPSVGISVGQASAAKRPQASVVQPLSSGERVNGVPQTPPQAGVPHDVNVTAKTSLTSDELNKLVSEMQRKVNTLSPQLQFSIDKESGKSIVKVTDSSTKEVIWQFPSEEALQITKEIDRFQQGMLVNRKA